VDEASFSAAPPPTYWDDDVAIQHEAVAASRQAGDRLGEARARNALGLLCLRREVGGHRGTRGRCACNARLRTDLRPQTWAGAVLELRDRLCLPEIDAKALTGLKFADALPRHLALATLAIRTADLQHAAAVLREPSGFER
jgi:hypothetical protein